MLNRFETAVFLLILVVFLFGHFSKDAYAVKASLFVKDLPYPAYLNPDYSNYDSGRCPINNCLGLTAVYTYQSSTSDTAAWAGFSKVLRQKGFTQITQEYFIDNEASYSLQYKGKDDQCKFLLLKQYFSHNKFTVACVL